MSFNHNQYGFLLNKSIACKKQVFNPFPNKSIHVHHLLQEYKPHPRTKLPSFLKQIFHIYYFLEEKHFYKKNLVVEQLKHTLSPFLLYNLCVAPIYKKPFFGILVIKISLYIFFCNLITLPIYVCVYPRILVMCQVH